MKWIVLFVAFLNFASVSQAEVTEAFKAEALDVSNMWPPRVSVTESVDVGERMLNPGPPGVLMRVEGRRVLLDMGRRGVYWVDVDKTDFFQRSKALQENPEALKGNYLLMLGSVILQTNDSGDLVQPPSRWRDGVNELIISYVKLDDLTPALIQQLKNWNNPISGKRVVLFPQDNILADEHISSEISGLLLVPWPLSTVLANSMQHLDDKNGMPEFVLVDSNGKILKRPNVPTVDSDQGNSPQTDSAL